RGIDIVARLFAADGGLIAEVDSERSAGGSERVELVADAGGVYKIEIRSSLPKAGAGTYVIRLSEVRGATADEKLLHEARKQHYESLRLNETGKTAEALELASRALEIREKVLGPDHAEVAASLRALGALYQSKDAPARAEAVLRRAAEVAAKTSGTETLDYADALHGLARVLFNKGDLAQAEQLNQRALSVRKKVAGPDSLAAADSLFSLALLYRATNDLRKAEQTYLKVMSVREKLLGADHLEMSHLFNNLGLFYYGVGDYASAEPLLQRSLAIREKALGPNHAHVGMTLNNLGLLEWRKGDYDKAEGYHRRALSIFEKLYGPDSDRVAGSLHNLAIIYKEARKDYAKAEEYYQRSLAISEKIFGDNNEGTANIILSLGILYRAMGDYDRAERFFLRALAVHERTFGPYNPGTFRSLRSLARLYAAKGEVGRAVEYQRLIGAREEKIISLNLTIGSERQKIAYFTSQLQKPDRAITLHTRLAPDSADARDLAATAVLQRKGRVLDALSENLSALRQRFNTQDQALLDGISDLNSQLARLVLGGPRKNSPAEHENQVKTLEQRRESIEAEISRRSAGFYEDSQPVTLAAVQELIPDNAALIEFAVYRPFDWKATDDKSGYGEPHHVVYVIRNRGEVRWAELGAAKEIDATVDALRQALRDPSRRDVRELARSLDEQVLRPVRALAGAATHLLVSPDGALNLIPFEALVDEAGRYLIQRYAFAYLTSGRDLLRMQVARAGGGRPAVVADPTFGEPATGQVARAAARPVVSGGRRRRSVTAARDLSEVYFAPLGGTAREARAIQGLFPEAELLTAARATEAALKGVAAPRVLHIATHGFFLGDAGEAAAGGAQVAARGTGGGAGIENPLLRSGLALAGANRRGAGPEDGILTA
ncbi:MAG: tetratricopeptide repeat protein, partial [Pyrinomonadaceae bacterium]